MGAFDEMGDGVVGAGGGEAVQVQAADGAHFAGGKIFPGGCVEAGGVGK
jgi:hypothetical protein